MAKDTLKDDVDGFEKMDDESLDFLEQVRKGNDRNFVLSMKDAKVRSLIVKKKPLNDKDKKGAKGGGYEPVFGVAAGGGASIIFYVARSDGFDEKTVECKTDKLKKFLKEQTGKPVDPSFVLLDVPRPIPFDENDLQNPHVDRFLKLTPLIDKARTSKPDDVLSIRKMTEEIRTLLQDTDTRQQAGPKLAELEDYLKVLLSGSVSSSTSTGDGSAEQLIAAMNKLTPAIKQAAATHRDRRADILGPVAEFHERIGKGDFSKAKDSLRQVAKILNSLPGAQTAAPTLDPNRKVWEARWEKLQPTYLQALGGDRADADKLHLLADYAEGQAAAGQYVKGLAALDRLEPLLSAAPLGGDTGLEKRFLDALKRWRAAQGRIDADFAAFRKAVLADESVRKDPRLRFVAAALDEMPNMLPPSGRQVEAALAAAEPVNDALEALAEYRLELNSSTQLEKLEMLAKASFGETLAVRDVLHSTLDEIEALIQGAA